MNEPDKVSINFIISLIKHKKIQYKLLNIPKIANQLCVQHIHV
jgi:hypothetical protein